MSRGDQISNSEPARSQPVVEITHRMAEERVEGAEKSRHMIWYEDDVAVDRFAFDGGIRWLYPGEPQWTKRAFAFYAGISRQAR
jgi:hypothetical protein